MADVFYFIFEAPREAHQNLVGYFRIIGVEIPDQCVSDKWVVGGWLVRVGYVVAQCTIGWLAAALNAHDVVVDG